MWALGVHSCPNVAGSRTFVAVYEYNSSGAIPYVPLLKVPYYIWLGKTKSVTEMNGSGHHLDWS